MTLSAVFLRANTLVPNVVEGLLYQDFGHTLLGLTRLPCRGAFLASPPRQGPWPGASHCAMWNKTGPHLMPCCLQSKETTFFFFFFLTFRRKPDTSWTGWLMAKPAAAGSRRLRLYNHTDQKGKW